MPPEIEQLSRTNVNLVRFIVSAKLKSLVLGQLNDIGINRKRLFPDFEGLSKHVNWQTRYNLE